jgi:hypothetical protein
VSHRACAFAGLLVCATFNPRQLVVNALVTSLHIPMQPYIACINRWMAAGPAAPRAV